MSASVISLGNIKKYNPRDDFASFKLSSSTTRDLSIIKRNISYMLYDIDNIIIGLRHIRDSFGGQTQQVEQIDALIRRYKTISDDLYYKRRELDTSAIKLCEYITANNKDKSNIASTVARDIRREAIK